MSGVIARVGCVGVAIGTLAFAFAGAEPPRQDNDLETEIQVREGASGREEKVELIRPLTLAEALEQDARISYDRLMRVGERMRYLRMPDGKVHVRIMNMWELGTSDVPARLIAVPAYGGGKAIEWEIDPPRMWSEQNIDRPLQSRWRAIERPVDAYKRRTIVLSLIQRIEGDILVGSCLIEMPGAIEVPLARVGEPIDPTTIEREWMQEPLPAGVRLRLPWPEGVFDAWLSVKAADGSSVWDGAVSRERMVFERALEGDMWAADPARATIYFPAEMPEGELEISVRWLLETP